MNKGIVLVTGSTRGIGKAIALEFLKRDYFVILNSRNKYNIDEFNWLKPFNGKFDYFPFDVSNKNEVDTALMKIINTYKNIDILVNNAGINKDKSFVKLQDSMWNKVIDVNLNGVYNVCKSVVPKMIENKRGRIINVSSVIALSGNFGQTNYSASKAGVIAFSKSLAQEIAKYGVLVNCVAPGFIDTDMTKGLPDNIKDDLERKIPLGYFGKAEDVANVVIFLSEEHSRYITGETISVNGGLY